MRNYALIGLIICLCFSGCIGLYDNLGAGEYNGYNIDANNNNEYNYAKDNNIANTINDANDSYKTSSSNKYYIRHYEWKYKGNLWTWDLKIPKELYNYYKNKPHNREENYAQYALSDYDKPYLDSIIQKFKEVSAEKGYSDYDTVMFVVSFVQSLKYTSDSTTTGYDEYPRYPIETLVDEGGDCEDTAILTASLLKEMGYDVVLIELPNHMAVGIKGGDGIYGSYYEYNGNRYYYLETTDTGWNIGEIPDEYKNTNAIIRPMIQIPKMELSFSANYISYDASYIYYKVHCDIENIGSGTAKNPKLYICALALSKGDGYVWKPDHVIELDDYVEGARGSAEAVVKIPRGETSQIKCVLYGDNFETVEVSSEVFNT